MNPRRWFVVPLLVAVVASMGAQQRTPNFIINAPNQEVAAQVAQKRADQLLRSPCRRRAAVQLVEQIVDGLRKAGLEIQGEGEKGGEAGHGPR